MDRELLIADLEHRLGRSLQNARILDIAGGDINRALRLDAGDESIFVKFNRAGRLSMFEAERAGLEAIAATGAIRVPRVHACGRAGDFAYLALEFVQLRGSPDDEDLAAALATMHQSCAPAFGFERDNTIGSTPQANDWCDDWVEFWRERRLGAQLRFGAANGRFDAALLDAGARLGEVLNAFFQDYRPRPSLLHGDLWSGNWSADSAGRPVIYDPACYYGDHETDLAMMELFGSPGSRFHAAYAERFPIDPGYRERRDLYNLYHLLNHANLFGGGYAAQSLRSIERLLAAA